MFQLQTKSLYLLTFNMENTVNTGWERFPHFEQIHVNY